MKKTLCVAAILAAVSFQGQAANRLGMPEGAEAPGDVLASIHDRPTGMGFVWRRDSGWQFIGQPPANTIAQEPTPAVAPSGDTAALVPGAPLAEFVDYPTGFRFVWLHGQGWKFVGSEVAQALAAQ